MIIENPRARDISQLKSLWREAFGDEECFIDFFFSTAYSSERCFAALENGNVLGALYVFDTLADGEKYAYLYAIATKAQRRGEGICTTLMQEAHAELSERGYAGAILVPASESLFAFYERLGYAECAPIDEHKLQAKGEACAITEIFAEEYFALRKNFLTDGSLDFSRESFSFIDGIASFYVGEDFAFALRRGEKSFSAIEFIGNTEKLPQAASALGFTEINARTPYGKKPFAMFLPFKKDAKAPSYLGFAFD